MLVKAHGRDNTGALKSERKETEYFQDAGGREGRREVCGSCGQGDLSTPSQCSQRDNNLRVTAHAYRGDAVGSGSPASVDNLIPHCSAGAESCQNSQAAMMLPMATGTN